MISFFRRRIPADEWKDIMQNKRLAKRFPSKFLIVRRTCGVCRDGVKFQRVWKFGHEDEGRGGYGSYTEVFSIVCRKCAPTREQLAFMSINFPSDMPRYERHYDYM